MIPCKISKKTVPSEGGNYKLVASLQANTHCHIQVTELLQLNKVNKVRRHCFILLLKFQWKDYLCYFYAYIWLLLRRYSCNITLLLMVLVLVHSHYKLGSLLLLMTCWCKSQTSTKHQPNVDVWHTLVHTRNHRCEYSLKSRSPYHCLQLLSTYINKQQITFCLSHYSVFLNSGHSHMPDARKII